MKVEAKDIPAMHLFMPEFWKTIKDFYIAEDNDEYWDELCKRCDDLIEIYPDSLAEVLTRAFLCWADKNFRENKEKVKIYIAQGEIKIE